MANQEQVERLKRGVAEWNQWREQPENRVVLIDLTEADLWQANLTGADLTEAHLMRSDFRKADLTEADLWQANLTGAYLKEANLRGTNFTEANLTGADFTRSDLRGANLTEANLTGVRLREANLTGAYLTGADLTEADLWQADLTGAHLREADFMGAYLTEADLTEADLTEAFLESTHFANVDLREVNGLQSVVHKGPSSIGIDTIYRSQGEIPEVFLKRAGVPESFVEYMHSLVVKPIDYYSCFISYSSKDQIFADRLYADLQRKNVRCWFAPHDLRIGQRLRRGIDEAIRLYDKLLLVLSSQSVKSDWVEFEVEVALEKEKQREAEVLFPIRLDNDVLVSTVQWAAHMRRTRHIGDFEQWKQHDHYQQAFERLLRDLTGSEGKNERK